MAIFVKSVNKKQIWPWWPWPLTLTQQKLYRSSRAQGAYTDQVWWWLDQYFFSSRGYNRQTDKRTNRQTNEQTNILGKIYDFCQVMKDRSKERGPGKNRHMEPARGPWQLQVHLYFTILAPKLAKLFKFERQQSKFLTNFPANLWANYAISCA